MAARLHKQSLLHHINTIGMVNGGDTMGDRESETLV
jgi:hypothetical protein